MADTKPDAIRLALDGSLTVRGIAAVRETVLEALAKHAAVEVDCSAADAIDLSLIQLLLAARRSAQAAGKSLSLATPADGKLRRALEQGGFLPADGADPFWSGAS